jgi:DNA mismatch repair ATPase MutS
LLKKWLKQPITDGQELKSRHEIVEYLFVNEQIRNDMQQMYLRTFPDLEKLYSKFYRVQVKMRHNATLLDCVKVYNMIHTLEALVKHLDEACIDE